MNHRHASERRTASALPAVYIADTREQTSDGKDDREWNYGKVGVGDRRNKYRKYMVQKSACDNNHGGRDNGAATFEPLWCSGAVPQRYTGPMTCS